MKFVKSHALIIFMVFTSLGVLSWFFLPEKSELRAILFSVAAIHSVGVLLLLAVSWLGINKFLSAKSNRENKNDKQ